MITYKYEEFEEEGGKKNDSENNQESHKVFMLLVETNPREDEVPGEVFNAMFLICIIWIRFTDEFKNYSVKTVCSQRHLNIGYYEGSLWN